MDKFIRTATCPVCSSPHIRSYKKSTFDYTLLRWDQVKITDSEYGRIWDLSECRECGHIFANPFPSPDFIFSLYSQVEDPAYDNEAEGRCRNFMAILKNLEKLQPAKGAVFDVGAATGILVRLARSQGWQAEGIEASSWAVKFAAEKYGLLLGQGYFEDAALKTGHYQAVTMIDFIEHTPQPRQAAAKAYGVLAPGGKLCLVTPDIHSFAARLAGKYWWHFRPGHLAYFSGKSLSVLLRGAGFRVIKKKRYAWTFSAHYLLSRQNIFKALIKNPHAASFFKRIPIKLALGDSFEIYAEKDGSS
jgi:2-polyprenyl-3-methyl-5-hydroxy-6-metoxy-1,4-benzoquinol methylase